MGLAGKDSCKATVSGNGEEVRVEGGVMMSMSEWDSIKLASNMDSSSSWVWWDFVGVPIWMGDEVFGIACMAKI